jgi:hypothetical protein
MFHGRTSTNSVSLLNTHPIVRDGHVLIHNGVVSHHGEKYKQLTSNDSEHIVYEWAKGGMSSVAANLTGYYAGGIMSHDGTLTVFRDAIASLHYAWCDTLESPVFATTRDMLVEMSDYFRETWDILEVKDNVCLTFLNGELIKQEAFVSRGWDSHAASLSHLSLGRSIVDDERWGWEDDSAPDDTAYVTEDYLIEQEYFDYSYVFLDGHREIGLEEYQRLTLAEQIQITVRRHDGTIVSPFEVSEVS